MQYSPWAVTVTVPVALNGTCYRKADFNAKAWDSLVEWQELDAYLNGAKARFLARDVALLDADANERSMTHKFAEHLQTQIGDDFHVDCEYNRRRHVPKKIHWRASEMVRADDDRGSRVYPDIIVHRRDSDVNILVIEAKKSGGDSGADDLKLAAFMTDDQYKYRFGARLLFVTDGVPDIVIYRFEPADHLG